MNFSYVLHPSLSFFNGTTVSVDDQINRLYQNSNLLINMGEVPLEKTISHDINAYDGPKRQLYEGMQNSISLKRRRIDFNNQINSMHMHSIDLTNPFRSLNVMNFYDFIREAEKQALSRDALVLAKKLQDKIRVDQQALYDANNQVKCDQRWNMKSSNNVDFIHHDRFNHVSEHHSVELFRHDVNIYKHQDELCTKPKPPPAPVPEVKEVEGSAFHSEKRKSGRNWYMRYQELLEFKKQYGHCNVKRTKNKTLGKWVANQRFHYKMRNDGKTSNLTAERIEALDKIGFEWTVRTKDDRSWQERFDELVAFRKEHGHCNVPQRYKNNLALAEWVVNQRYQYKKVNFGNSSYLTPERIEILEKLGFEWSPGHKFSKLWPQRFEELLEFKKENGHCNVPYSYKPNEALGLWVVYQRHQYRRKHEGKSSYINEERIEALDKLGFEWNLDNKFNKQWQERFDELVEFKKRHGHCNVSRDRHNGILGRWVSYQRSQYNKRFEGKVSYISKGRIEALEQLGFQWKAKKD